MNVSQVMSSPPVTVAPDAPVREAALLMRENNVGMLPVLEGMQLVGIVTDRDLVISVLAVSRDAGDRPVRQAMSSETVVCCKETQSIVDAMAKMGDAQIERLPVVDQQDRLIGVITVGDIAVNASEVLAGQAIGEICEDRRSGKRGHRIKPRE